MERNPHVSSVTNHSAPMPVANDSSTTVKEKKEEEERLWNHSPAVVMESGMVTHWGTGIGTNIRPETNVRGDFEAEENSVAAKKTPGEDFGNHTTVDIMEPTQSARAALQPMVEELIAVIDEIEDPEVQQLFIEKAKAMIQDFIASIRRATRQEHPSTTGEKRSVVVFVESRTKRQKKS